MNLKCQVYQGVNSSQKSLVVEIFIQLLNKIKTKNKNCALYFNGINIPSF